MGSLLTTRRIEAAPTAPERASHENADRIAVLGSFRVLARGRDVDLPVSGQRLVAYLALHGGVASRPTVTSALWPDVPEPTARASLRTALWRLRRIEPDLVLPEGSRLTIPADVSVDATEVEEVIHTVLTEPRHAGPDALETLTRAETLLPDWDDDWIVLERERLRELRLEALERLAEDLTERGQVGRAVQAGLAAVAEEPFRESSHRVLIEAYLRKGNIVAALKVFRGFRRTLDDELGVAPSDGLRARVAPLWPRVMRRSGRDRS